MLGFSVSDGNTKVHRNDMPGKVVEGYSSGYLTDFAAEIEQYYNTELDD